MPSVTLLLDVTAHTVVECNTGRTQITHKHQSNFHPGQRKWNKLGDPADWNSRLGLLTEY